MKISVLKPVDVEATHVFIRVPVRYGEEDIPNNFPLRKGDMWIATVEIETGRIAEWPAGSVGDMHMKVCDEGVYRLMNGIETVAELEHEYVPSFFPGDHYGDYIIFKIDANGVIEGWARDATAPRVKDAFFSEQEA